jgi:hypothetical protein
MANDHWSRREHEAFLLWRVEVPQEAVQLQMIKIVGAVLMLTAVAVLRALRPKDGKLHPLATAPVLEDVIPFVVVAGLFVGLILIVATGWSR